ncbi:putative phage regulatory protein [Syntrophobotulus glycolicus DSM 8271]|uniref:Phage regulatory protein n=1 Tax=Syntrophobotulus glycolicus (strain DSM 8271 / FlGlyR) TaxID=645991 RepID=F0T0P0_SYNGF|nr:hypothetical protein [Syntrophobotulus glycolicus]ADY55105.1 putative phage regulatory protein [Syntrophobotulus glycolicus DSM 8271]
MRLNELTPFGVKVKQRLLEERMTQAEFCEQHKIPTNRFSEILYGIRPGVKYREMIADILNIDEAA